MTNHVSDTDSYTEFYLDDCQVVVRGDVISKAGECEDVKFEKAPIQGRYGNIIINRVDGSMNIYSDE